MSEMTAVDREIAEKVLTEVEIGLASLLDHGAPHVIDLRRLPKMSEDAYKLVKETLGRGEASLLVDTTPRVEIIETAFAGVWWATYYRPSGDIATEMIEITFTPRLLTAGKAEAFVALDRLRKYNADKTQAA